MRRLATKIFVLAAFLHVHSISGWTSSLSSATNRAGKARYASTTARRCYTRRRLTATAISCDVALSAFGTLDLSVETPELPNLLVPFVAFVLLVASQSFINQMLNGDQGLGAFLKDGRGVGRSSFRPLSLEDKNRAVASDPLPWLKLPKLDYVEVAGQATQREMSSMVGGDDDAVERPVDSDEYPAR